MVTNLKGKTAIVGVGETDIVPKKLYNSYWHMSVEAAKKAVADAGLTAKDIDGLIFVRSTRTQFLDFPSVFLEHIGLQPSWTDSVVVGGMPANSTVYKAALAVEAGLAKYVLIVRGDNMISRLKRNGMVENIAEGVIEPQWELPFGMFPPAWFGFIAHRHMHNYGTTSEQLAAVAVAERKHASLHPNAQMRQPITIQDVLNSKMIADPIHLLDMALVSDGGGAMVVTSAERAKDCKKPPVYLLGFSEVCGRLGTVAICDSLDDIESHRLAAERAFQMAEVTPADIDVAFPYDASTIVVITALETMGFCKKGEGGAFVEGGRIEPGGQLPVNTHGGLLSYAHYTMTQSSTIEAVRQLRGECGERQAKGAKLAVVQHEGGSPIAANCVLILGRN